MGTYGFDDFKLYLKTRCGSRDDVESISGQNLYGIWVNEAYLELTTRKQFFEVKMNLRFPELETVDSTTGVATTDGTPYVAMPTGAVNIIDVYDYDNEQHLEWITVREYFKKTDRYDTSAEGKPTKWTRFGSYIYLHPTPDASTYNMVRAYRKIPDELTGSSATAIGSEWDPLILELATYKAYTWLRMFEESKFVKDNIKDMLAGLIGIYDPEEFQRDVQFRPAPDLRQSGRK
jgi:hypothetical protein